MPLPARVYPQWRASGGSWCWCRACLYSRLRSRGAACSRSGRGAVSGLRPRLPLLRPHELRALHQALLLRIVTVVSCRGKTHNEPSPVQLSVENSKLFQQTLFTYLSGLTLTRQSQNQDVYSVFVWSGKSSVLRRLIVLKWHRPCLIAQRRCNRRTFRHNPTSDPHSMSSACPT